MVNAVGNSGNGVCLDLMINGKDVELKYQISFDQLIERNTVCKNMR